MICNECETVAHCMKNGCIPKVPQVNKQIEALKLALGALLSSAGCHDNPRSVEAIKAIRAAIAKGEQA